MFPQMPNLQDEIGKKRPFDLAEEEAYLNIRRTAAALESEFGRLFRQAGLSEATYNVLRILRSAGADGRCWGEIRQDLVVPVPDVTRLIDRLEQAGHCERQRCASDRRKVYIKITPKGRKLVDDLDEPVRQSLKSKLGHVDASELKALSRLLEAVRTSDE